MEIHNPFRNIIGSCAQLSKSYKVLNLTEKNRDLLFDTVAPCVKTVCSFIRDNIVRSAKGSTGSCLTMQYTTQSCHHQSTALSQNYVKKDGGWSEED